LYNTYGDTIDGIMTDRPTDLKEWTDDFAVENFMVKLGSGKGEEVTELTVFIL